MSKIPLLRYSSAALLLAMVSSACIALGALEEAATPSGQITAIPVEPTQTVATEEPPTEAAAETTADEAEAEPTELEPTEEAEASESDASESGGAVTFQISQDDSEVRFLIDEILRGEAATAVGSTNQIVGEIVIDIANPAVTQIGVIQINARTLETDEFRRNRVIQNRILSTGVYEWITFATTSISGLPEAVTFGEAISVQIIGDLTITEFTNEIIFEGMLTQVSESQIVGSVTAVIQRADYGLQIPSVPMVAEVSEEVVLELDFTATAQ